MKKYEPNSPIRLVANYRVSNGLSPYRLVKPDGQLIDEVNEYLDLLATRGLSLKTVRAYAYDLLNFYRWLSRRNLKLSQITKGSLLEYIRYQNESSSQKTKIAQATINHRLTVVSCLYNYHFNRPIPSGAHRVKQKPSFFLQHTGFIPFLPHKFSSTKRSLRVKMPKRITLPLTKEEVRKFLASLKTWRDIAMTAFMLLCGLRSREVIGLKLDDIRITEDQVRICGKGRKERVVPLPGDLANAIRRYLQLERPKNSQDNLFVLLKGPNRGSALTPAGLRSLYRYHRKISGITNANPHRFRHTFGANMARAGIPLPALMKLMGHSDIKTTIGYVNISVNDIREEFHRVVDKLYNQEIENGPKTEN